MTTRRSSRWVFWQWVEIMDRHHPGEVYLRRLRIIDIPWFGVYLHWIFLPDTDRDPHDHPWPFWSIPLRGGYTETVWRDVSDLATREERTWRPCTVHRVRLAWAHRIDTLAPGTLTLILRGPRLKSWGFWTEAGVVHWRHYPDAIGAGPDPFDS